MGLAGGSDPWLLAWVMIEIHCKDSNHIKPGKCLVLDKHLCAGATIITIITCSGVGWAGQGRN